MCKRCFIAILIISLLINLQDCYSLRAIRVEDIQGRFGKGDIVVYTTDTLSYYFKEHYYGLSNDSLYGTGYKKYNENSNIKVQFDGFIPLSKIGMIKQDELNPITTTLLIFGGVVFIVGVVFIIELANSLSQI